MSQHDELRALVASLLEESKRPTRGDYDPEELYAHGMRAGWRDAAVSLEAILSAPVEAEAQAEWYVVHTPGADFDWSFFKTFAEAEQISMEAAEGDRPEIIRLYAAPPIAASNAQAVKHGIACDSDEEREDCYAIRMLMSNLLTRTANVLKGEPAHLHLHSWHDLPEVAEWLLSNPPKHAYWGGGEKDCPREIKASNGELHTLRCKICGQDNPRNSICRHRPAPPIAASDAREKDNP